MVTHNLITQACVRVGRVYKVSDKTNICEFVLRRMSHRITHVRSSPIHLAKELIRAPAGRREEICCHYLRLTMLHIPHHLLLLFLSLFFRLLYCSLLGREKVSLCLIGSPSDTISVGQQTMLLLVNEDESLSLCLRACPSLS